MGDQSISESQNNLHAEEAASKLNDLIPSERFENRVLNVRRPAISAIFKLHSGICELVVEYMTAAGFYWLHTPRLTNTFIEGDNEFFPIDYFGQHGFLAQSSQFHKQMAIGMNYDRVYEIGPLFRAERKLSTRHLTEFTGLDFEMVYDQNYLEVARFAESLVVFVIRELQRRERFQHMTDLSLSDRSGSRQFKLGLTESGEVFRITFHEAKTILRDALGFDTDDNVNFTAEEETALGVYFRETPAYSTDLFTIIEFPSHMRHFYSASSDRSLGVANSFDLILRGQEVASGSQHLNKYNVLCEVMRNHDPPLDPDSECWRAYTETFKCGVATHGGCGIGINRLLQGYLDLKDVREATLFPRDAKHLAP